MTSLDRPAPPPGGASPERSLGLDRTVIDPELAAGDPPQAPPLTAEPALKLGPGLRIEHYELIRELGRGGMGQVYLARDTRLGRRVAMKFLTSSSPKLTERFLVEARATARCSHENIVVIHDVAEHRGRPYMVLEYVEGASLARVMRGRRLPVGRAVELIVPVVKALALAHAANIVHRDLKPENIVVTLTGTVKVLDFGVATLLEPGAAQGGIAGTLPYMSPEQLGTETVDHRSDLWAIGILLFELLAAKHPLDPVTQGKLFGSAAAVDEPMPSLAEHVPGLPDRLVAAVAKCLAKRKGDRFANATELLAELEPLMPGRARGASKSAAADESPYPGLHAFQESDASRFFGRGADVASMVARLRDQPLVGVVGPSGVGKSSFIRAGVVPALKASGEAWEIMIVRPGRHPLAALASQLDQLEQGDSSDSGAWLGPDADGAAKLRAEPGVFGARLRARARRMRSQILLFVDQHEELYTLVHDAGERLAFTACLVGAADDPAGPLRVAVAMRSDFLDRAAEDRRFVEELARGLVFLQPPDRAGLEEALVQPLDMLGYGFEPGVVASMLDTLGATPGPLPLLQFTAAKLWEHRDRARQVLTRESYLAMGGVAGALATHADEVLARFAAPDQKVVRAIFLRLVTPERTRAIVDVTELRETGDGERVDRVLGALVASRLVVVHTRGEGDGAPAVELVHESLVKSWPTLQRWLDESHEDAAFVAQLRTAAKQWDQKGRAEGLLWRNEAMEEARLWRARYPRELPAREQDFLDAVLELGDRASRRRRRIVVGSFAFLLVLVAAAGVALVQIRAAERSARETSRQLADKNGQLAESNTQLQRALDRIAAADKARQDAETEQRAADANAKRAQEAAASAEADAQKLAADKAKSERERQAAQQRANDEAARNAALAKEQQKKDAERAKHSGVITNTLK